MTNNKLPYHVAIIMDGNGRWANRRGLPRVMGHREGVKAVKRIVTHAVSKNITYLTLFAFSTENWLRPKDEVSALMKLLDSYLDSELKSLIKQNVKFKVSGQIHLMPESTRKRLLNTIESSANNTGLTLNLALSYGGRTEILDAAKKMMLQYTQEGKNIQDITENDFESFLYNPEIPPIDLLIRTSGEKRISNFMLWRLAYSELYFTDTLWPGFYEDEFDLALDDYAQRKRRFGKTDEQI